MCGHAFVALCGCIWLSVAPPCPSPLRTLWVAHVSVSSTQGEPPHGHPIPPPLGLGKTSFLRSLNNQDFNPEEVSTNCLSTNSCTVNRQVPTSMPLCPPRCPCTSLDAPVLHASRLPLLGEMVLDVPAASSYLVQAEGYASCFCTHPALQDMQNWDTQDGKLTAEAEKLVAASLLSRPSRLNPSHEAV